MSFPEQNVLHPTAERLEGDRLDGFASGTGSGELALDVFFSKDLVQYLHQCAPTMSRSENQPPPPWNAACDLPAAAQKQP
jgi:hypothetical protein